MTFEYYASELKPIGCGHCGAVSSALKNCTACHCVRYCNVGCQKADWKKHKKDCAEAKKSLSFWHNEADRLFEKAKEPRGMVATDMFIVGSRLGIGDSTPTDHTLVCRLYEKAATLDEPCPGGHPDAMLHLALHYERGLGMPQSHDKAYQYYNMITKHPHPGEEVLSDALKALSRFHAEGLGGAEQSEELSLKYLAFAQSNPESAEELEHIERWYESGGRDQIMKTTSEVLNRMSAAEEDTR